MDVYLVPVAGDRYALYSEHVAPVDPGTGTRPNFFARTRDRVRRALAESTAERHLNPPTSLIARLRHAVAHRVAEVVAEQQLLWHLRRPTEARLVHPDDLTRTDAIDRMRELLLHDRDRHRRWAVVDAVLTVATTPAALLPGPNVFAYYFLFRSVGHWFAQRGASRGLSGIVWQAVASPHLTSVRAALPLGADLRVASLTAIATALGLVHAGKFIEHIVPADVGEQAGHAG
jgi:hypothetical protein